MELLHLGDEPCNVRLQVEQWQEPCQCSYMEAPAPVRYLADLAPEQRKTLERVNKQGLADLRRYLDDGNGVAFLGAGASVPLYRPWAGTVSELLECASSMLTDEAAAMCRAMAVVQPDAAVEIIRRSLGAADYRDTLRKLFRARKDPVTGKTWTIVHELVARCNFAGVVTTNYDPGIVEARKAVRPDAVATDFASWPDEDAMDRWRTRDIFTDSDLPVLYAHGHHNRPEAIVLATTEYRRAYRGKLARVLGQLIDTGHLVWIGFSFADQRITSILREIGEWSGTEIDPGPVPRHVAVMPWDPAPEAVAGLADPQVMHSLTQIQYGARPVLYPALGDDHSALARLLEELVDPRFPAVTVKSPGKLSSVTVKDVRESAGSPGLSPTGTSETRLDEPVIGPVSGAVRLRDRFVSVITVDQSGLQGAQAAASLREMDREMEILSERLHRRRRTETERVSAEIAIQLQAFDRSLSGLSERALRLELATSRRLRAEAARIWSEMEKPSDWKSTICWSLPSNLRQDFKAELVRERREREQQFLDATRSDLAIVSKDGSRAMAAEAMVADLRVLRDAINEGLPHERFAPSQLSSLERRLTVAEGNLAQGLNEAALAQAQDLYQSFGELRVEIELDYMEWHVTQIIAGRAITGLLERIEANSCLEVTDEQGTKLDGVILDVDLWSDGELAMVRAETEELARREAAQADPPTLEELREIVERYVPSLDARLENIVGRARVRQGASQFRVNLAELAVSALEEATGLSWAGEAIYAGNDPRRAFYSRLRHPDGGEVVVEVTSTETEESCVLRIHHHDGGSTSEAERARQANAVADALRHRGFQAGALSADLQLPDLLPTDSDRLRQQAAEREHRRERRVFRTEQERD